MTNYNFGEPYRSAKTLSLFAIAGLAVIAFSELVAVFLGVGQIASPDATLDLDDTGATSFWLMLQSVVALLQVPAYIFTIVFFLIWLHRAHSNLSGLRPVNLQFSPGWAVGWWFIPFANLVKPFQVVREIWWESDPVVNDQPTFLSASLHSAPTYMGLWWAFWLISNFLANVTSRVFDPEDMRSVEISGYLFIVSGIAGIIAAVLAIRVVKDITGRQEHRYEAVGALRESMPPPPPTFGAEG